jgi:L-cysteine:1D-myo-inositol 2-amino-2-deoxy-alpha-D-glucopyranoside ligase
LQLYNSLTRSTEAFSSDGTVSMYVCGVTPYDTTHVGHARTYLVFDILIRHLLHAGERVKYIQNITDVDESILAKAAELDEPYDSLGDRFTGVYMDDIAALGIFPADAYPRASEAIPEMQEMVRRLLASGHAYRADRDVFFRVSSFPDFGRLSRLERAAMLEIEAEQADSTVDDDRKEDALDFVLWRDVGDQGPSWDSPWGPGRPGWHLECSTLALKHLGRQIDIHGGGSDLVYPHHEDEIAQAEAVTGVTPFARFWIHVAMARLDGDKMAKSKGNVVFVRELLKEFPPDALRLYLLDTHYREPLDFARRKLEQSAELAVRLSEAARRRPTRAEPDFDPGQYGRRVVAALDDDLDTPGAIAALAELAARVLDARGGPPLATRRELRALGARLGLNLEAAPR